MAKGQRPDPRKRKSVHAHSTYLEVKNGTKVGGWKAGELYGCYAHHVGHTKPCVDSITEGALKCTLCEAGFPQVFRAYLPLWDREYQLRHVLIGEEFFEATDRIAFRHPLTLSRVASMRSPLKCSDEPMMVRALPDGSPWDKEVEMLSVCLTIWKDETLARWVNLDKSIKASDNPLSLKKSDGKPFSPEYQAAARRAEQLAKASEPPLLADPVNRLITHVAETTHNGNGKPKPKG